MTAAKLFEPICPASSVLANQCGLRSSHTNSKFATGTARLKPSLTSFKHENSQPTTKLISSISTGVRTMASTSPTDPMINDILDYWFRMDAKDWFMPSSENDATITKRFGPLVEKARLTDELDVWTSTPGGTLALIILLDQFTRNIFRPETHAEPGLSWSGDAKALQIAAEAISKGFDRQVQEEHASSPMLGFAHRFFMYIPYMHAEEIHCQVASCALFDSLHYELELRRLTNGEGGQEEAEAEKTLKDTIGAARSMAVRHRDCIVQVGRFPKRNEPLGRETSEAERKFLEEHPHGF